MSEGNPTRDELREVVELVARQALDYLEGVDRRPVLADGRDQALASFSRSLPSEGVGAGAALRELLERGPTAAVTSSGPRCFHFVIGGTTPAALGADWTATLLDQMAYAWVSSPLAVELELLALEWLKELFELPRRMTGIMTTGATMANFVGLASARQWWARQHGVDLGEDGFTGLPPVPVLSSGILHASPVKVLSLLGMGRASVRRFQSDPSGRLDLDAMEGALRELDGAPAILVGNAGEVNAGGFDPIDVLADLAREYNAWLHVDGAFGLFARLSPRTAELVRGVERADSVTVDGHKWLNVPYDCGFAFVRDGGSLAEAFAYSADYLPDPSDPRPTLGALGPESSRRARALAVWATLRAYGRDGYRRIVETHLELAERLARSVDEAPDLERLADVPLNIVCFRYNPGGLDEGRLDDLNDDLGRAILDDGRVYAGTTRYMEKVALRPAISNWRTRPEDVDLLVDVVRELGARLHGGAGNGDSGSQAAQA